MCKMDIGGPNRKNTLYEEGKATCTIFEKLGFRKRFLLDPKSRNQDGL